MPNIYFTTKAKGKFYGDAGGRKQGHRDEHVELQEERTVAEVRRD